ncbi:hypothetical protein VTN49DRAFT_2910 [Thermomyces lanuginosus]|uniref:uncharacterized protein n=1 Tax=Thermomyces lanuginosus TaxID=5541 RepID=UPI003743AC70
MADAATVTHSITESPHSFLQPSSELHHASRLLAKNYLDPLASSLSTFQQQRQKFQKKRKRSEADVDGGENLRLQKLYVDGFAASQIWEQAIRIINATANQVTRDLSALQSESQRVERESSSKEQFPESDEEEIEDEGTAESVSEADEAEKSEFDGVEEGVDDDEEEEEVDHDEDELAEEGESELEEEEEEEEEEDGGTYVEDPFGLNDGFFSIDEFNRQTQYFEQLDERGEDEDDEDEEPIDWHADPNAIAKPAKTSKQSKKSSRREAEDEEDDSSEDEDGPTFDHIHGDDDSDDEEKSDDGLGEDREWINTNDIMYDDFFAPPARKASEKKKSRPLPKTQPEPQSQEDLDREVERAMANVRRDLFEDDDVSDEDKSEREKSGSGNQSTHERQKAKIADEIRRLEAANVAKKEWMYAGEARASQRPSNSLIEHNLEFEHVGKPVPVVTSETTEEIEQLIKRRIIAREFDEVIRRNPLSVADGEGRRGRIELDDNKPQKSLAELYEADHLQATDANYVDPKDERLRKEHEEIRKMWKEVASQLDTLSNWHYKPQPPQAQINVITDVATIAMEEARPTAAGIGVDEQSRLAPQEIYNPREQGALKGEVVTKSGAAVAKDEMSREEKARLRKKKKKEAKKKAATQTTTQNSKEEEKKQLLSDLKKGGVKVVGEKGELRSLDGKKVGENKSQADRLKL